MTAWFNPTLAAAALVLAGCADPDDAADAAETTADTSTAPGTAAETDTAPDTAATDDSGSGYEVPLPEPLPPGECEPGTAEPCTCEDGAGERVCLPSGVFSACGCPGDDGVYEPPPPPVYEYCEDKPCKPYPFPASDYSATHCCMPEGECGSTNANLFEAYKNVCLERGAEKGTPSADCPDESIAFIDFLGCCRSDGQCGMTLDETMPNWDTGCVDRTQWKPMLDGLSTRWWAAIAFGFDPAVPEWAAIACTPPKD